MTKKIPVIDLFAGPGGLGEGFSSLGGRVRFDLRLSIEKDIIAHRTLTMRAVYRVLKEQGLLDSYYAFISRRISRGAFLSSPGVQDALAGSAHEARRLELGPETRSESGKAIREVLKGTTDWVLIGGPPCQAYSVIGRARNTHVTDFHLDQRHFLYKEYLHVLQEFQPAVFVMENVKGLLSSQRDRNGGMFQAILNDLRNLGTAEYEIRSVVTEKVDGSHAASDFIVRAEDYGIPQARHRVILLGVRKDYAQRMSEVPVLKRSPARIPLKELIGGLPKLRSRLSSGGDFDSWLGALDFAISAVEKSSSLFHAEELLPQMRANRSAAETMEFIGDEFVDTGTPAIIDLNGHDGQLSRFLLAGDLSGVVHHSSRSHMGADVARYFFASSFAQVYGHSPTLDFYPDDLMPKHANINRRVIPFKDRFRVQLANSPAKTIVAHMSKDGHAFIHFDPAQARSLTVREAARTQSFPDDYFFEGGRTAQYVQVGNAVPPYLALQIAKVVARYFR